MSCNAYAIGPDCRAPTAMWASMQTCWRQFTAWQTAACFWLPSYCWLRAWSLPSSWGLQHVCCCARSRGCRRSPTSWLAPCQQRSSGMLQDRYRAGSGSDCVCEHEREHEHDAKVNMSAIGSASANAVQAYTWGWGPLDNLQLREYRMSTTIHASSPNCLSCSSSLCTH